VHVGGPQNFGGCLGPTALGQGRGWHHRNVLLPHVLSHQISIYASLYVKLFGRRQGVLKILGCQLTVRPLSWLIFFVSNFFQANLLV